MCAGPMWRSRGRISGHIREHSTALVIVHTNLLKRVRRAACSFCEQRSHETIPRLYCFLLVGIFHGLASHAALALVGRRPRCDWPLVCASPLKVLLPIYWYLLWCIISCLYHTLVHTTQGSERRRRKETLLRFVLGTACTLGFSGFYRLGLC